jgi:hypothetical protein
LRSKAASFGRLWQLWESDARLRGANADIATIKSDQHRVEAAQEVETAQAKASSVDFVT